MMEDCTSIEVREVLVINSRDLFSVFADEMPDAIVNTVNTMGVMGAGIALEFKLRFPKYFETYKEKCKEGVKVGEAWLYEENPKIISLFVKENWKFPSRLEWVLLSLKNLKKIINQKGLGKVIMPVPGTGKGKLNKNQVIEIIQNLFKETVCEIIVCKDEEISEKEKLVLETLKHMSLRDFLEIGITKRRAQAILRNTANLHRFRDLLKLQSIGIKTYEKLFLYFNQNSNTKMQNRLF